MLRGESTGNEAIESACQGYHSYGLTPVWLYGKGLLIMSAGAGIFATGTLEVVPLPYKERSTSWLFTVLLQRFCTPLHGSPWQLLLLLEGK
jgi:hypothetical protein